MNCCVIACAGADLLIRFARVERTQWNHVKNGLSALPSARWCIAEVAWRVDRRYYSEVLAWARHWYAAAEIKDFSESTEHDVPPTRSAPAELDWAFRRLHLLPTAPDHLVDGVVRLLAKRAHPDCGGSTRDMMEINNAADVIRRARAR